MVFLKTQRAQNLAHTWPSPTKTKTAGGTGGRRLKQTNAWGRGVLGWGVVAADNSHGTPIFFGVPGALCGLTASTGTEPVENVPP